jgi:hypothetical protein
MLEDLAKGLAATKRNDEWNLVLPFERGRLAFSFAVNFELVNDTGAIIGRIPDKVISGMPGDPIITPEEYKSIQNLLASGVVIGYIHGRPITTPEEYHEFNQENFDIRDMRIRDYGYDFGSAGFILNRDNNKYSVWTFNRGYVYNSNDTVFSVSAGDITDIMTVRVGTLWQKSGRPTGPGILSTRDTVVTYGPDIIPVMTLDEYKARGGRPRLK